MEIQLEFPKSNPAGKVLRTWWLLQKGSDFQRVACGIMYIRCIISYHIIYMYVRMCICMYRYIEFTAKSF